MYAIAPNHACSVEGRHRRQWRTRVHADVRFILRRVVWSFGILNRFGCFSSCLLHMRSLSSLGPVGCYLRNMACLIARHQHAQQSLHTSCKRFHYDELFSWDDETRIPSARSVTCTASGLLRLGHGGLSVCQGADSSHMLSLAQAAGMLAAKRASDVVPTRMSRTLRDVQVWIHAEQPTDHEATDRDKSSPSLMTEEHTPASNMSSSMSPKGDGGFSAEGLLDPDTWMAQAPEPAASASAPSAVTDTHVPSSTEMGARMQLGSAWVDASTTVRVVCRTRASEPTHTEAMAACMATCLSLCDIVHASCGHMPVVEQMSVSSEME